MATVHTIKGNLLTSDVTVLIHQANCQVIMGGGIAKQLAKTYPSVLSADRNYNIPKGEQRMGKVSHSFVDGPSGRLLVMNLYAQTYTGVARSDDEQQLRYDSFRRGLRSILNVVNKMKKPQKIGLPYGIGCGLAGSDWSIISGIIQDVADEFNHDIYLYKL